MLCSAFFSGSETALSALTRTQIQRMQRERKKRSSAVVRFLEDPRRLFITVLFGNTLVNMAFVTITGALIYDDLFHGGNPGAAYVVAILVETGVLLLLGEITPKTIAIRNAERMSLWVASPLWAFSRLIFPFRRILRFFTDRLLPVFGVHAVVDTPPVTSEEIRATVQVRRDEGDIDEREGEILSNIVELQDTRVKEIMIPRTKMVCVEVSATIQEAFRQAIQEGYSRLPVYRRSLDNICGIFYVKDLPRWKDLNTERLGKSRLEELTIDEFLSHVPILNALNPGHEDTLIRPPFFVFKTRNIGALMREMTHRKQQMAILLDEFGGVVGLATAEDIVEEVVGEIEDEYDAAPGQEVVPEPGRAHSYLVPGALSLRTLNRRLKLSLDITLADTVGGYVTNLAGTLPQAGDRLRDETHNIGFEVLEMAGNRIELVRVQLKPGRSRKASAMIGLGLGLTVLSGMSSLSSSSSSGVVGIPSGWMVAVFLSLLVFSLFLMSFFNGSETAVVSASMARMEVLAQQSDRRALFIKHFMQEPERMLGTVLVGTNLMAAAAGVAGLTLTRWVLPGREGVQELVNTLVMTLVIMLFCEIVPKTVFRAKADVLALRSAPALRFSDAVLRPIVLLMTKASNLVVKFTGREDKEERSRIMREELKLLAEMGQKEGALKKAQIRMIHGILDLEERTIGKIMTPLVDMTALPEDVDSLTFLNKTAETGYSRIPVYHERIDNIVGVVNVLDVLAAPSPPTTIRPFIREDIRHEPGSRRVFPLLRELTRSRRPMVFVVDEYGGVVGLVTIEDLVEEVMGEIWDEKDREEVEAVHRISERVLDCDGKTEIQILNHDFDLSLPEGEYNTIAGLVIERLQRIPRKGESLTVGAFRILVLDADAKSVRRVRITKK
jgi:CBS domain containing-hemolysin-like protein